HVREDMPPPRAAAPAAPNDMSVGTTACPHGHVLSTGGSPKRHVRGDRPALDEEPLQTACPRGHVRFTGRLRKTARPRGHAAPHEPAPPTPCPPGHVRFPP